MRTYVGISASLIQSQIEYVFRKESNTALPHIILHHEMSSLNHDTDTQTHGERLLSIDL